MSCASRGTILLAAMSILASPAFAQEKVPQQLGELVLGKAPPSNYIHGKDEGERVQGYRIPKDAWRKMWPDLAPGMPDVARDATVTTYKGRVAEVVFRLDEASKFEVVHGYFTTRLGKGQRTNTRLLPGRPGDKDCPPLYRVQHWSHGSTRLTLLWDEWSGVTVVLHGDLIREVDRDPAFDRSGTPCLPFNIGPRSGS